MRIVKKFYPPFRICNRKFLFIKLAMAFDESLSGYNSKEVYLPAFQSSVISDYLMGQSMLDSTLIMRLNIGNRERLCILDVRIRLKQFRYYI